ncbi:MAG: polysaccharide biosynthesis tyrosine autokinase [Parvularculaceae bacterium]|nr:polysaccharide biosynthesis tyrosine autokinase [Parvularculaceae bacterium]
MSQTRQNGPEHAYAGAAQRSAPALLKARAKARTKERAEREFRLGATLKRLGKLNDESLGRIEELQRRTNAPFAHIASSLGLLTREDVETAIGVQNGFIREGDGEGRLPQNAVIVRRPKSKEAEQFRAMRTRLLTSSGAEKLNLFAIAGGKSARASDHVAVNLAASFAQLGRNVLLVDADLRATRLARNFGLEAGPGLRETLAGETDIRKAIRPTVVSNLSVLTSGALSPSGHELLSHNTLGLTFEYLRCAFDIVIVMTAPFGPVADAQFVWAAAGGAFIVTRRNHDRMDDLKALNAALRQVEASVIGAALAG